MDNIWGANFFGHDASLCVVKNNKIIFHEKSEEHFLTKELIDKALKYDRPKLICYYEKPWLKKTRQLYSGDFENALSLYTPRLHFYELGIFTKIKYFEHHQSHAAAGYYTSPFNDCVILVADAIGEWDTLSIWHGDNGKLKKLMSKKYPYSLGLFYSAFTKQLGFIPVKQENEVMQLSIKGKKLEDYDYIKSKLNLNLHKGVNKNHFSKKENIALSVQTVLEEELIKNLQPYQNLSKNFIFMGGCAYNTLAFQKLKKTFTNSYTLKNPGDFSSAIGAVGCYLKEKLYFQ